MLLLVVAVFVLSRGDNDSTDPSQSPAKTAQLVDYADKNSEVSLTTIGRLVGNDEHRQIRITLSASERRIEVFSGYDQQLLSSQTYTNNSEAYETFLSALGGQGFIKAKETDISDSRSVCPTGRHYEYLLTENGEEKSNLWSVSCDRSGTFNGRGGTVRELFQRQIPDYTQQVSGVVL